MNRTRSVSASVLLLVAMPACDDPGHSHAPGEAHTHGAGGSAGAHPAVAITHWTDRTELFMEYPLLVAGNSSRSAIHVTNLADFSPLATGEAIVTMRGGDGRVLEFRGAPTRPGIFGVDVEIDRAGVYGMTLRIESPDVGDLHDLGPVTVYAPGAPLPVDDGEAEDAISFLKEQQWTLDFGTTAVAVQGIRPGVTVPATIEPRSGGEALVAAPVPGRADPATPAPVPGTRVRAGALLARIAPESDDLRDAAGLRADRVEAEQLHALALADRERAARLLQARAVPARRLAEAEAVLTAAKARLDAAHERWNRFESLSDSAGGGTGVAMFAVRAPFAGIVSEVRFTPGAIVEQNGPLLRLVDPDRVHVVGSIPESLASSLEPVTAAELVVEGRAPVSLGEPLATSPVIDPVTRTAAVRFALDNREPRLRIGQAVRLRLFVGDRQSVTAVPETAIVDDGGRPVVFVQTGGESFERRPVRLGNRAEGSVQVLVGVVPGERVVHRGAYLVRLAAMSTSMPSHGHVH